MGTDKEAPKSKRQAPEKFQAPTYMVSRNGGHREDSLTRLRQGFLVRPPLLRAVRYGGQAGYGGQDGAAGRMNRMAQLTIGDCRLARRQGNA